MKSITNLLKFSHPNVCADVEAVHAEVRHQEAAGERYILLSLDLAKESECEVEIVPDWKAQDHGV